MIRVAGVTQAARTAEQMVKKARKKKSKVIVEKKSP